MHVDDGTGMNHNMWCCRPRQKPLMQTAIAQKLPLRVLQQDTERYTAMIYAAWMLHIANFYDLWWGLLAIWTGHYHGMKFVTSGMSAFGVSPRRPRLNHGLKFVYDAIGIWHNTSQHYLGIVGSKRLWLGNHRGIDASAAQNIAGIICLQIFAAWKIHLHGRWLLWMMIYGVQCFLNSWISASADVYRKKFHNFSPALETGCPMGYKGLTVDRFGILVNEWQHPRQTLHHWNDCPNVHTSGSSETMAIICLQTTMEISIAHRKLPEHRWVRRILFGIRLFDANLWEGGRPHTWD